MKQKIRFYLEGGGSKCSYQLSTLKHLFENKYFNDNFELESIYGISFGAVMGYFYLLKEFDASKKMLIDGENLLNKSIDISKYLYYIKKIPFISNYVNSIENIIWILYSLKNYGLFDQRIIEKHLRNVSKSENNLLHKLNVLVYNINKNKVQIINGSHPLIIDYIMASMSVWLIFPPKKINLLKEECECDLNCKCNIEGSIYCNCNLDSHRYNEFMDIGFLYTIPFECISDNSNNLINCYLLTNPLNNDIAMSKGNNLLEYLYNIIDTLSTKHQNLIMNKINFNLQNNNKILHVIYNNSGLKTSEINIDKINMNIKKGYKISKKYIRYLKSNNKLNNKIFKF